MVVRAGGKYLAEVAAYLKGINHDVLASFVVAGPLVGVALRAAGG
jgi:hypothetical protein